MLQFLCNVTFSKKLYMSETRYYGVYCAYNLDI